MVELTSLQLAATLISGLLSHARAEWDQLSHHEQALVRKVAEDAAVLILKRMTPGHDTSLDREFAHVEAQLAAIGSVAGAAIRSALTNSIDDLFISILKVTANARG